MATTTYCTQSDVEAILSSTGVLLRGDDDEDGVIETGIVTNVLERASLWVNQYCRPRGYSVTDLAANDWVKYATAAKAAQLICRRRGNPVPSAIEVEVGELTDWLKNVHAGNAEIPDLAFSEHSSPALSNLLISGLFRSSKIRVQRITSTGGDSKATPRFFTPGSFSSVDGPSVP